MYTLYNTQTNQRGDIRPHPYTVDGKQAQLPPHLIAMEVIDDPEPSVPRTKRTVPVVIVDVPAKKYRHGWEVVDLSAEEMAERDAEDAATTERQQIRAVIQDLKDGTGTQLQRLVRCERVPVRLIKDYIR